MTNLINSRSNAWLMMLTALKKLWKTGWRVYWLRVLCLVESLRWNVQSAAITFQPPAARHYPVLNSAWTAPVRTNPALNCTRGILYVDNF